MSEYQYIYFAAVDRALDDKQLAYMRSQSTRATAAIESGGDANVRAAAAWGASLIG